MRRRHRARRLRIMPASQSPVAGASSMHTLLIGSSGQLGRALRPRLLALGPVTCAARAVEPGEPSGTDPAVDVALDLARPGDAGALVRALRPDLVVNAAAYTAVDRAEEEPALARRVNAEAVEELGVAAAELGAPVVTYSTDYVFGGERAGAWREEDEVAPESVYGHTKRDGELALIGSGAPGLVLRTSWVYAARGKNFVLTMLRLGAEREQLRVVADQVGVPNWSERLAELTVHAVRVHVDQGLPWPNPARVLHLSAAGAVSWHGFAEAIFAELRRLATPEFAGTLAVRDLEAIPSSEFPTPARRPANSVLAATAFHRTYGVEPGPWREDLVACLREWLAERGALADPSSP